LAQLVLLCVLLRDAVNVGFLCLSAFTVVYFCETGLPACLYRPVLNTFLEILFMPSAYNRKFLMVL